MSDKARLTAYKTAKRIFEGAFSNLVTENDGLSGIDRAFAESIALGTLERKLTLEFILSKAIHKETNPDIMALLMTGVYQVFYMDKVPDNAACDETVEIAKILFGKSASGFVNAVMRNLCRNKDKIDKEIENAEGYIKYSANKELFELIKAQYPECYDDIFNAFFGKAPTFIRVNTLKIDAETVANKINGRALSKRTVRCENAIDAIKYIDSGEYYIQGLCSQRAVELLGAMPDETIVDVCACPGGKTLGAAIDMDNRGRIYSFDLHGNKLPLIEKSAKKLGISIITTEKRDARKPKDELLDLADRVICDVPCSGTGVMGSKPEIKYKSPKDFEGLYNTQKAIIRASAKYLKAGGTMVYSTCSINKKENEEIVYDFLSENNNYKLIAETTYLPFRDCFEGFYMAKIIREN